MNIRQFTIGDLEQCLHDNSLWGGEIAPITKHRAQAQVRNPRADADDVALLVAYDGQQIVGYLGILPDRIYLGEGAQKIGWLTAWWAEPGPKYAALGLMLLMKALRAWDDNIGVSGFAISARKFYDASKKFVLIKEPAGIVGVVRCVLADLAPRKWPRLKPLIPALRLIDAAVNPFVMLRLRLWAGRRAPVVSRSLETIGEEVRRFISSHQQNELTRRGPAEFEWIMQHPWVLTGPHASATNRYYFSSMGRRFAFFCIEVREHNGRLVGFLLLNLHDDSLSVPYCYCSPADAANVAHVVARHAITLKVSTITTFNQNLLSGLRHIGFPFLYKQAAHRPWIVSAKFKDINFASYALQDGEGDCAFT